MDPLSLALLVAAAAFALLHGVNNGAVLVVHAVTVRGMPPAAALIVATLGVLLGPFVVGTAVASALAVQLVHWDHGDGRAGLLTAVLIATALASILSLVRIPVSMTLAFVGAIAGFGAAAGLVVTWGQVVTVLVVGAVAPFAGALVAAAVDRAWLLVAGVDLGRAVRIGHWIGFPLLSLAYGANDAQKALAVATVAVGATGVTGAVEASWWLVGAVALLFALGTVFGAGTVSQRTGAGLAPVRPKDAVTIEVATAASMLSSTALGAPVALGQALAGAVVGTGIADGRRAVRWGTAARIGAAWVLSFPIAFGIAWPVGALVG